MIDQVPDRPQALEYESARPIATRPYRSVTSMILAIVGLAMGSLLTLLAAGGVYAQVWGDADVGAPCVVFLAFIGPFILLGSIYGVWMVVRARQGKTAFTPGEARSIFNRDGWTGLRNTLRGSNGT